MRGADETSGSLFSCVGLEERIPPRHPLRKIRQVVNDALTSLDAGFEALYADFGRPCFAAAARPVRRIASAHRAPVAGGSFRRNAAHGPLLTLPQYIAETAFEARLAKVLT